MVQDVDVVVVGGGVMGTSAARWLAKRNRHTVLLERFEIGHAAGSSTGPTRVFRLAYHHPEYARMARLALDEWRALEAEAGADLMITTAGLDLGAGGRTSAEAMEAAGVAFERLSPEAVHERWPAVRIEPGTEVVVQEDGGVCMAERTVLAQAELARAAGVAVLERTPVESIVATGTGTEIRTAAETYRAPVVVVTAGPWERDVLRTTGLDLPLVPSFEQVTYFALDEPSPLPTIIDWDVTPDTAYVVPNPEEAGHFKVALHMSGPPVEPDERTFDPDPERVERVTRYAAGRFAPHRAEGGTDTCLYTNTPDEDFVLDRRGPVVIGSPCSGHGFKFAPLIGRILADLATAQPAPVPIERFLLTRFLGRRGG